LDLLGRARSLFKGMGSTPVAKVQYYSVACPLGHRLRGQRTGGYQALRCPSCGEGIFVLPASPLPEPVPPARSAPARTATAGRAVVVEGPIEFKDPARVTVDIAEPDGLVDDVEIRWEDDVAAESSQGAAGGDLAEVDRALPEPAAARPDQNVDSPSRPRRPRSRPTGQGVRAPVAATLAAPGNLEPTGKAGQSSRRPILILACVALIVLGTVALRTWRHHRQNLPQVARIGQTEGIAALQEGKFDHAYQLLSAAREAVDALGGGVEDADEIRHAADEATIFVNVLSDTLESLLEEAARTSPQAWATRFDTMYKGRAVVIDASITATPDTAGSNRYELDYLVLPAGEGSREQRYARIDLTGFEAITLAQRKVGDHVTFGARLAAFQYDPEAKEWMIRFEPKSGVSITHFKALESMGWPSGSWNPDDAAEGLDRP